MPGAIEHSGSKAWVFPELEPAASGTVVSRHFPDLTRGPDRAQVAPAASRSGALAPETDGRIRATTISFRTMSQYGDLLVSFMEARKRVFIDHLHWDVPSVDGMEFDQYDTPASRWVAVHQLGRIYAGIRLTPTTARVGIYSYMIRDAQRGLLDSIPSDLLYDEAPVAENVWESSRVFVAHDTPEKLRRVVHLHLIDEMTKAARDLGATQVLGLISASWPRWAQRRGLDAHAAGRVMEIEGSKNQVVSINLAEKMH